MVRGLIITHQGKRILGDNLMEGIDPRGRPYYWIGPAKHEGGATPGSDLRALEENRVSITPVHLNLTNVAVAVELQREFE
jgi:5'-nucleotidase